MSAPPQQETCTAQRKEPRPERAARTRDSAAPDSTRPETETNNGANPGGAGTDRAKRPATEAGQRKQTQQERERKPQPQATTEQPRTKSREQTREKPKKGTPERTKAPGTETERRKRKSNQRERESTRKKPPKGHDSVLRSRGKMTKGDRRHK